jgi:hypothetical protein
MSDKINTKTARLYCTLINLIGGGDIQLKQNSLPDDIIVVKPLNTYIATKSKGKIGLLSVMRLELCSELDTYIITNVVNVNNLNNRDNVICGGNTNLDKPYCVRKVFYFEDYDEEWYEQSVKDAFEEVVIETFK